MSWMRTAATAVLVLALAASAGAQDPGGALGRFGAQAPVGDPPLAGTFEGLIDSGLVRLEFEVQGGVLTGTLTGPGIAFGLEGELAGEDGFGLVHTGQGTAAFEAYIRGDVLGLYLFELDAAGEPVMASVIELLLTRVGGDGPQSAPATPDDPILATGRYATLTQDNAAAFVEALEFVLAQVGYAYQFDDSDRLAAYEALAVNFPAAEQIDQVVMAEARTIWERVKANWSVASLEDQREFALGVLILAFGEETVAAWVGPQGAAGDGQALGGGGQCATFEDCAGSFVDEQTWSNTFNAQGCWAAAGCSSFDPSTSSFSYDDY